MDNPDLFSSAEALRFGWQQTRSNLKSLLPIAVVAAALAFLQQALRGPPGMARALVLTVIQLLQAGVTMIWIAAALRLHDGHRFEWQQLLDSLDGYFAFLLTAVLYALIIAGGLILLIVPGVLWAIKYSFAGFVVVDRRLDPISALRESARITQRQRGRLFWFGLALLGINLVGALAFGVGLFVTVPTSYVAGAWVYRRLEAHAGSTSHLDLTTPLPVH
jgi:uncharacterized membrane protein